MEKFPKFKYHPNLYESDYVIHEDGICQCCKKKVRTYINTMYCAENINCICLDCVADGSATKKFDGTFIQDAMMVSDKKKKEELFGRTPGYHSWQGEYWLACCDDYCAYIGDVGSKELVEMGIADEVFDEYEALNEHINVRESLTAKGSVSGYLFKCLHCSKYHLWVDTE